MSGEGEARRAAAEAALAERWRKFADRERAVAKARDGEEPPRREPQPKPMRADTPERRARAKEVEKKRREGMSYRQIEKELGISQATVSRDLAERARERGE